MTILSHLQQAGTISDKPPHCQQNINVWPHLASNPGKGSKTRAAAERACVSFSSSRLLPTTRGWNAGESRRQLWEEEGREGRRGKRGDPPQVENLLVLLDLGLSRGCLTEMKLKIGMLCCAGNCRCSAPTKYESRFLPLDIVQKFPNLTIEMN